MRHRLKIAAGAAALWSSAATGGLAQPSDFPAALDVRSLTAWIGANTSLPTATIVSVGANSIIGLRSAVLAGPDRPGVYHAQIWSEVISRPAATAGGYMSWSADIDVDCQSRRSKATRIQNYPLRNLGGVSRELPGAPDWVSPTVGTQLYSLIASVCDPNYKRPLSATKIAAAPPAPDVLQAAPAAPPAPVVVAAQPAKPAPVAVAPKPIVVAEAPKPAPVVAPSAPIIIARAEPPALPPPSLPSARVEAAPKPVAALAPVPIPTPAPAPVAVIEPAPAPIVTA
ncbi:MAG: hypothetical protein Q8M88_04300, partial [Phenylobacterium sp.]|nr:hypothetical protein [Phenylobacterium sp.]